MSSSHCISPAHAPVCLSYHCRYPYHTPMHAHMHAHILTHAHIIHTHAHLSRSQPRPQDPCQVVQEARRPGRASGPGRAKAGRGCTATAREAARYGARGGRGGKDKREREIGGGKDRQLKE